MTKPLGQTTQQLALEHFSPANAEKIQQLASQYNLQQFEDIQQFGQAIQQKNADMSQKLLQLTQSKDLTKVSDILQQLMEKLVDVNPDLLLEQKRSFFQKLFGKSATTIPQIMTNFQRLFVQIDRLSIQLQFAKQKLQDDLELLQRLAVDSAETIYQMDIHLSILDIQKRKLIASNENQSVHDLQHTKYPNHNQSDTILHLLDQRHYDLQLSKQVTMQTSAQLLMIMQNHQQLIEKLQSSILATIPLWKNQMSMLFTLNRQLTVAKLEQRLLATSKEIIEKNNATARHISQATLEQQGQADFHLEALKQLQTSLLQNIQDSLQLQKKSSKNE